MEIELNQLHDLPHSSSLNNIDDIGYVNNEHENRTNDKLIYIYNIVSHIFVFSLCESFFFWFYITKQENDAFENQFNELKMISNLICINYNIDLSPYYDYLKNNVKQNNQISLNYTYIFNGGLFCLVLFMNGIMKLYQNNIVDINKNTYKNIGLLMLLLFMYEFMFFNNVIYNYKPKSIVEINKLLFDQCLDD